MDRLQRCRENRHPLPANEVLSNGKERMRRAVLPEKGGSIDLPPPAPPRWSLNLDVEADALIAS